MVKAEPSIDKKAEELVSKGRWEVPGYKVQFYRKYHHLSFPLPYSFSLSLLLCQTLLANIFPLKEKFGDLSAL